MKTVFTASELMTVAVKELEQMCIDNAEPIRFYCWNCGTYISSQEKPVHDELKHETEPEGEDGVL